MELLLYLEISIESFPLYVFPLKYILFKLRLTLGNILKYSCLCILFIFFEYGILSAFIWIASSTFLTPFEYSLSLLYLEL